MWNHVLVKTARVVATGVVGAAAYDGVKRVVSSGALRRATVTATAWVCAARGRRRPARRRPGSSPPTW
jgi:hypothetical protein